MVVRSVNLRSPEFLAAVLSATPDLIVAIGEDGAIGLASRAADRILGRAAADLVGRTSASIVHPDDLAAIDARITDAFISGTAHSVPAVPVRLAHADGRWVELEASGIERVGPCGATSVVVVLRETRTAVDPPAAVGLDQTPSVGRHDPVTRLPGRSVLETRLDLIGRRHVTRRTCHLVMIKAVDLAELRIRLGDDEVSSLLQTLAWSVRAEARPRDLVAEFGDGEFVVLVESSGDAAAVHGLAERMLGLGAAPLARRRGTADVRLAAGIARIDPGDLPADSLRRVAKAATWAEQTGAPAPVVADERLDRRISERSRVAADVERALAAGELQLYFQPLRDLRSARIAGFEGLLRWNHPEDGLVPASRFLPAVEGTALMVSIGHLVLEQGCAQLARWQRRFGDAAPSLALNVSARQLRHGDFARRVRDQLDLTGAEPSGLCLELTETHALEQEALAKAELDLVREMGVRVALDDFGTGYSSLHNILEIRADVLKIDRAFVRGLGADEGATAIVRAAIELGQAFGATVVAEGVTTIEQHQRLRSMGCDQIQGFLIAPALPPWQADEMLVEEEPERNRLDGESGQRVEAILLAHRRLTKLDAGYQPSVDEIASVAGVPAALVRRVLTPRLDLVDEDRAVVADDGAAWVLPDVDESAPGAVDDSLEL